MVQKFATSGILSKNLIKLPRLHQSYKLDLSYKVFRNIADLRLFSCSITPQEGSKLTVINTNTGCPIIKFSKTAKVNFMKITYEITKCTLLKLDLSMSLHCHFLNISVKVLAEYPVQIDIVLILNLLKDIPFYLFIIHLQSCKNKIDGSIRKSNCSILNSDKYLRATCNGPPLTNDKSSVI